MSDFKDTPPTVFESLSSLARAIPKITSIQKDLILNFSPTILFNGFLPNELFLYSPIKPNTFLYRLQSELVLPTQIEYLDLLNKHSKNLFSLEYMSDLFILFKKVNKIEPCALVESISPGCIHWFTEIAPNTPLFDLGNIFKSFPLEEVEILIQQNKSLSPFELSNMILSRIFKI